MPTSIFSLIRHIPTRGYELMMKRASGLTVIRNAIDY